MGQSLIEFIKSRRSVRSFSKELVPKETIEDIIQAGRFAPSAEDKQPWKFIVITDRNRIDQLSLEVKKQIKTILKRRFIYRWMVKSLRNENTIGFLASVAFADHDSIFFNAPVLIFIVTKKGLFNNESCACCAQNMMLAAHAVGLGSCWIGFAHFLGLHKSTKQYLQIPRNHHIAAALIFGVPKNKPRKANLRRVDADIIQWFE